MNSPLEQLEARIAPATLIVSNDQPNGAGSLADAVAAANALGGSNKILFEKAFFGDPSQPRTIVLADTLEVTSSLKIVGPGRDQLTISGNDALQILNITDGNPGTVLKVALSGMSLRDGDAGAENGGAINNAEQLSLMNLLIANSDAELGGGIYSVGNGSVTIKNTTISGNIADDNGGGGLISVEEGAKLTIDNVQVINNEAQNSAGGGLLINAQNPTGAAKVSISNSIISGNSAVANGGLMISNESIGGKFVIKDSTISGNESGSLTGGIYLNNYDPANSATFLLERVIISGNQASFGAGLRADGRTQDLLVIKNSLIDDNTSTLGQGGGVTVMGALSLEVASTTFSNNSTPTDGGGILFNSNGTANINSSSFSVNSAANGGALSTGLGVAINLVSNTFSANSSTSDGGAVHSTADVDFLIKGGSFTGNQSGDEGGAIYVNNGGLRVDATRFAGNMSVGDGGALFASNVPVMVSGGRFSANVSDAAGGAMALRGTDGIVIGRTVFESNQAGFEGGAVIVADGGVTSIARALFASNRSALGGGLSLSGQNDPLEVSGSQFRFNQASDSGGGAYLSSAVDVTISKSVFTSNSAGAILGGGLAAGGVGNKVVDGSKFVGNYSAGRGGGLGVFGGQLLMTGSTVTGNSADISGGGVRSTVPVTITSSAIFDNSAPADPNTDI